MKSASDPRHKRRIAAVKELFAQTFHNQNTESDLVKSIFEKLDNIDKEIETSAPAWPKDKINRIDLAILRLAAYELIHTDTPQKVIIDEAVELAKEFGNENSPSFVNGVLGDVLKRHDKKTAKNKK